jgi:hypothetical protein
MLPNIEYALYLPDFVADLKGCALIGVWWAIRVTYFVEPHKLIELNP